MKYDPDDPRITAYLFDELEPAERLEFETLLQQSTELRQLVDETRATVNTLRAEFDECEQLQLNENQRAIIEAEFLADSPGADAAAGELIATDRQRAPARRSIRLRVGGVCVAAAVLLISACVLLLPTIRDSRMTALEYSSRESRVATDTTAPMSGSDPLADPEAQVWTDLTQRRNKYRRMDLGDGSRADPVATGDDSATEADVDALVDVIQSTVEPETWEELGGKDSLTPFPGNLSLSVSTTQEVHEAPADVQSPPEPVQVESVDGLDAIALNGREADVGRVLELLKEVESSGKTIGKDVVTLRKQLADGRFDANALLHLEAFPVDTPDHGVGPGEGGDKYDAITENDFLRVADAPLSTFSIDVDTASYSKVRVFLNEHHQLPRPDAVRIEELVNYFPYNYEGPTGDDPFAAHQAVVTCPWNPEHLLVRIGIKGKEIDQDQRPASNLVFLLDVSGSMDQPNKLPLLKRGMKMLADQLSENDRVAIVVYAGAAGMVLDSTTGDRKPVIVEALDRLNAGGSTNGGAGIQLAYQTALDHFITGGVNRVILCTDGDFNVGTTGTDELVRIIEQHAKSNVFLSVLGFGMGNHNDSMLEQISNKGNGNYAFVDTDSEARKVLVEQMSATLVTIAKDVKIQIEFNPAKVGAYRLIGYENRVLAAQDFNDDTKDAGEIGAGHTVTALYEVVPVGKQVNIAPPVDELKYQTPAQLSGAAEGGELLTLKLRYKQPDGDTSQLLTFPLDESRQSFNSADRDFQFAAAVASFGMLLRNSSHKGDATYASVLEIATAAAENDATGYRQEFLQLVRKAAELCGEAIGESDG